MPKIPYRTTSSAGTASRTITLDMKYWAMLYESSELMHVDFRVAISRAIAILHAQQKQLENTRPIEEIPNIEN